MLQSLLRQLNQGFFDSLPSPLPRYLNRVPHQESQRLSVKSSRKQLSPFSMEETAAPRGQGTVQGSGGLRRTWVKSLLLCSPSTQVPRAVVLIRGLEEKASGDTHS